MIAVSSERVRCRSLPAAKQAATLKCHAYFVPMLVWPLMTWFDPWPLCSSPLFMHVILIILAGDLRGPPKWKQTSLSHHKSGANTSDQTPVHAEIWHLGNMNHSHTSVHIWSWCCAVITVTRTEKKKALKGRQTCKGKKKQTCCLLVRKSRF